MPAPNARTMSSGPPLAVTARKITARMTTSQPARRHGRPIHGEPSTTVETMPAMNDESIVPIVVVASLSHSGRWTAASSSGVPARFTTNSFRAATSDCASRAATSSIPNSRNLRRHSTTRPTPAGMKAVTPWKTT